MIHLRNQTQESPEHPGETTHFSIPMPPTAFPRVGCSDESNVDPYNKKPTYCQEKNQGVNQNDFYGGHPSPCSPFLQGYESLPDAGAPAPGPAAINFLIDRTVNLSGSLLVSKNRTGSHLTRLCLLAQDFEGSRRSRMIGLTSQFY